MLSVGISLLAASAEESSTFLVTPSAGLIVGTLLVWTVLAAGVVTLLKGQWGWAAAGLLTGGLLWCFSAFAEPAPGSWWQRRRVRRAG